MNTLFSSEKQPGKSGFSGLYASFSSKKTGYNRFFGTFRNRFHQKVTIRPTPTRLDPVVERTPLGPAPLEQLARPHFAEELEADRLGVDGLPRVLLPHLEPRRQARRVDEVGVEVVLHVVGAHPPILRG